MSRRILAQYKPPGSRRVIRTRRVTQPTTITFWTADGEEHELNSPTQLFTSSKDGLSMHVKAVLTPESWAALRRMP